MLAVESSRPVSLYEAHFKAIGKPKPRPLVQPSRTAKKKPPQKGFRLARKRAKGGFARDKEVIKKFNIKEGIAREKPTKLESVSVEKRKTKKEKETEQALQIVRDDPRRPVDETTSILREAEINKKLDRLDEGFDDKIGSVFEELRSEIRFGSEPADIGAGRRRRRKKKGGARTPIDISRITTAEQFYDKENNYTEYRTQEDLVKDYPRNIAILKALRDERFLDRGLYNEFEAGIRRYNQDQVIAEDRTLEQNAIAQEQLRREKQRGGGRYTGAGSGGFSTLDSTASSVDSSLAQKLERARVERRESDRRRDQDFEAEDQIRRLKRGQQVISGADAGFLTQRQAQKEAGLLAHSSDSATSSGDEVRRSRGLSAWTEQEDELSSGNLRSDGTSTSERESVASDLDRQSQDEWARQSSGRVAGHFQKFETRKPITRAPAPEPQAKPDEPTKAQRSAVRSGAEITQELASLDREQRSIDEQLTQIRRARGRSGERAGRREEQLSEEAPLIQRLTQIADRQRRLEELQLDALSKQRTTSKKDRRANTRSEAILQIRLGSEGGGTNTTAEAIRFGSEVGTDPTGGKASPYGVKPRSKAQAETLLTELAKDSKTKPIASEEQEQLFQHLDGYLEGVKTDEPKIEVEQTTPSPRTALDLQPITPPTAQEELTPRGRGESPSPEQQGGGVLGGVARAIGGGALGVAQGVGGAIAEQLPEPRDVARGIARAGTGAVLGAVQGVAEGVSGALGGAEEQTDV